MPRLRQAIRNNEGEFADGTYRDRQGNGDLHECEAGRLGNCLRRLGRCGAGFIAVVFFVFASASLSCESPHAPGALVSEAQSVAELPADPTSQATVAASPTATASVTPTPAPAPAATSTATVGPRRTEIHPNELGKIMVLGYHVIGDQEERWTRARQNFRKDLEYLYNHGYYLIGLNELLDNRVRVPAGKTPVVLSFDDSNRSQFQLMGQADGTLKPDPKTAVGIIEDFTAEFPDFGRSGLFCVLPGADPPNDLFGQQEYSRQKLQYLVQGGYEICNHTLWHADLGTISEKEGVRQIALATKAITDLVPGYKVNTFNPPHGTYPKNRGFMLDGSYEGTSYHHRAVLKIGANPSSAPNSREASYLETPRIQAIQSELDRWFGYFEKHPEERYVSDGDPDRVTFPALLLEDFVLPPGAQEEPASDTAYKVFRLR